MIPLYFFQETMLKTLSIASTTVHKKVIGMPPGLLMQLQMQVFIHYSLFSFCISSQTNDTQHFISLSFIPLIIIFCYLLHVGIALKDLVADPLDHIRLCVTADDQTYPDPDTVLPSRLDLFTSACKAKTSKLSSSVLNVFSKWIVNPCTKSNEQVVSSFERCISDDATICTLGLDCSTLDKCLIDCKQECASTISSQITAFNQQVLPILLFFTFSCIISSPSLSCFS